jgi:hypothetical protein
MARRTLTVLSTATAALLALAGGVVAQSTTPSQADFDLCNREAQAKVSSPSASPSASPSPGAITTQPSASPATGAGSGAGTTTGSAGGTTGGAPSASGPMPGGSTAGSDLRGIAPDKTGDMAYQTAYRDCMKQRGF